RRCSYLAPPAAAPPEAAEAGLRPRLKLTPTATDEEFKTVFEAAGGREPAEPAAAGDGWTWKELLSSMDEAPPSDESLASLLIGEIEAMGVDAAALLPRPRIDEIAAAIHGGDTTSAADIVRRLAPAAIRRLSRRMLSDRRMRAQAERYVRRYQDLWTETVNRGDSGVMAAALLGSDQGRAYLLLDAALGEVA
ncbi:MAG: polar localization protein TipN, partial [Caulobacteraceae bacterium]|nr:polar localization protein TipN [Caulobacteraceae bacterium]